MIVWLVETIVATTLLMLVVLAIRTPVRRNFGPAVAYALWAIPALRMVLPPLPESWRGGALPVVPTPQDITVYLGEPLVTLPAEPASGIGWPAALALVWTLGAIAFIGYHIVAHGRFCARVRAQAADSFEVADGRVRVFETDAATGPLAFGVVRKYVAFPRDFADRYDPLERDLALAHELGHHARGDLLANWFALAMLAVHWFNPVAWRAFRAFRADQEMACDALVLAGRARELRAAYGRAIVKSAHGGAVSAACHLHTINEIKGRLKMLGVHEKTTRTRLLTGGGAVAALLIGSLGLTASGTHAAERVRTSVERATGVDLAAIQLPALPAVPAPPPPPAQGDLPPPPPAPPAPPVGEPDGARKHTRVIIRDKDGKVSEFNSDSDDLAVQLPEGARVDKRTFVFRRDKDGKPFAWDGRANPMSPELRERLGKMRIELRDMPRVSSRTCAAGEGQPGDNVIRRNDGDKKVMIICTNRIERMASLAAVDAQKAGVGAIVIQRRAEASALAGLRNARRTIETNQSMGADQRSAALAGIDEAIRDLEAKKD
jgi:beta-lactamase regulating signal transducer with metallopeptidase domain